MASVQTGNTGTTGVEDPNNPFLPNGQPNPNAPQGSTQNNNNQPSTSGGAGAITSTGAANVTGQVVGTNAPAQPFQNIAQYLAANAPQSQQLATNVANTVSQPITNASNEIATDTGNFNSAVNTGWTPTNNALITAVSNNPAAVVAENPQNATNFAAQLNDKYTGPSDITQSSDYSNLEANIAAAQANAANTNTPAGIQTLLGSIEGPTTQGINNLDTALLSSSPQNVTTVENAGQGASALTPNLNAATTNANANASAAATAAPATATAAQNALGIAQSNEATNLNAEQSTIQGIVDTYNQSVGVIDPTIANIAASLSTFLAQNPQISVNDAATMIQQLQTIAMPNEATYASPQDYAQIAALAQLGDTNVNQLPINASEANQAQTFNVPTALQNALGQAPALETGLQNELNTIGGDINTAVAPFQAAQDEVSTNAGIYNTITGTTAGGSGAGVGITPTTNPTLTDPTTGQKVPATITQTDAKGVKTTVPNPAWNALIKQAQAAIQAVDQGYATEQALAPSLQWVNGADTNYQNLINTINSDLGKLGTVGAPTLNYGPNTVTDPVTGVPIGTVSPVAQGAGAAVGAGSAVVPTVEGLSGAGYGTGAFMAGAAGAADVGGNTAAQILSGLGTAVPPAALAAYGTSNIVQNTANNPIQAGIMDLANTGLSLATLSLPPQIFKSIGNDISNIMNDIGKFFGGLF